MKKLFLLLLFCSLTLSGFAFSVGDLFIYNSRFWQNKISLDLFGESTFSAGATFTLTDHKDINDKIYAFRLPLMLKLSMMDFVFEPFIYPEAADAEAYGGSLTLNTLIKSDDISSTYVNCYLKASLAKQKANFRQFAFETGLNFN